MADTAQQQLSPEDLAWLDQPVDVEVEPDNQAWLNALLELTQPELINFAVLQYGVPEEAAKVSNRNDLLQLIVMANRGGGGTMALRSRFMYIRDIKDLLAPAVVVRGGRALYQVRGQGNNRQVWDKVNNKWTPLKPLLDTAEANRQTVRDAFDKATTAPGTPAPSEEPKTRIVERVVERPRFILSPKRADVEVMAVEAGVGTAEEVHDQEKFPSIASLVEAIEATYEPTKPEDATDGNPPTAQ